MIGRVRLLRYTFVKNIFSVGILQIANYAIPILVIPFVTRALGRDGFGTVSYAQNIIAYMTLLVTFGYEYSATQDVALVSKDKIKRAVVFWTVVKSRLRLFLISLLLLLLLSLFVGRIQETPSLYFAAAMINLGVAIYPTWFFQGMEEMGKMAVAGFFIKFIGGLLVIALVRTPADALLYLALMSGSYVVVGLAALVYVVKQYEIPVSVPEMPEFSRSVRRRSYPIFLNALFVSIYTIMGLTILGRYVDDGQLGIYSGASRIIMAVMMIISTPINVGIFPMISKAWDSSFVKGWMMFKKALVGVILIGAAASLAVYFTAPLLVSLLLGPEFQDSIPVLLVFSILPLLVTLASLLTVQGLYGMQRQKLAPIVGFVTALFGLVAYLTAIPVAGIKGAAYAWVASQIVEILVSTTIIFLIKRNKK